MSVGEELRDGRLEAPHVELPTRVLVRPSVALGVGVVPEAAAEAHSESKTDRYTYSRYGILTVHIQSLHPLGKGL